MKDLMEAFLVDGLNWKNVDVISILKHATNDNFRVWMYDSADKLTHLGRLCESRGRGKGIVMPVERKVKATFPEWKGSFAYVAMYNSYDNWCYFFLPTIGNPSINKVLHRFISLCLLSDEHFGTFLDNLKAEGYDMNTYDFVYLQEINTYLDELNDLAGSVIRHSKSSVVRITSLVQS